MNINEILTVLTTLVDTRVQQWMIASQIMHFILERNAGTYCIKFNYEEIEGTKEIISYSIEEEGIGGEEVFNNIAHLDLDMILNILSSLFRREVPGIYYIVAEYPGCTKVRIVVTRGEF